MTSNNPAENLDSGRADYRADRVWSIAFGSITGFLLATAYVWLTVKAQNYLDIPRPSSVPRREMGGSKQVAPSYWASWLIPLLAIIGCGGILALRNRGRIFALVALATFLVVGVGAAFFVISLDVDGFAP